MKVQRPIFSRKNPFNMNLSVSEGRLGMLDSRRESLLRSTHTLWMMVAHVEKVLLHHWLIASTSEIHSDCPVPEMRMDIY